MQHCFIRSRKMSTKIRKLKFKNSPALPKAKTNNASSSSASAKTVKKRRVVDDPFAVEWARINALDEHGWTICRTQGDFQGPLCLINAQQLDEPYFNALTIQGSRGVQMAPVNVVLQVDQEKSPLPLIEKCEPDCVEQVFHIYRVASNVANDHLDAVWSIKSSIQPFAYLSSTKFGQVQCESLAVSVNEQWLFVKHRLQQKFLIVSREFGAVLQYKNGELRCDCLFESKKYNENVEEYLDMFESVGGVWWHVKCQSAELKRYLLQELETRKREAKVEVDPRILLLQQTSTAHGKHDDLEQLKRAQQAGNLNEALLDSRAKTSSDRYCK